LSAVTDFSLIVLIFWIGYERLWEVLAGGTPKDSAGRLDGFRGRRKALVIYLVALVIGYILSLGFGVTLSGALISDGWTLAPGYVGFDSFFITPLLFAGGPDLIHQVMALIQNQKERVSSQLQTSAQ